MQTVQNSTLKQRIVDSVEAYHQANFWTLFPAGKVPEWVFDALEAFVQPYQDAIDRLQLEIDTLTTEKKRPGKHQD